MGAMAVGVRHSRMLVCQVQSRVQLTGLTPLFKCCMLHIYTGIEYSYSDESLDLALRNVFTSTIQDYAHLLKSLEPSLGLKTSVQLPATPPLAS